MKSESRDDPAQRPAREVLVELNETVERHGSIGTGDYPAARRQGETLRRGRFELQRHWAKVRPHTARFAPREQFPHPLIVRPLGFDEGDHEPARAASSALTRGWS